MFKQSVSTALAPSIGDYECLRRIGRGAYGEVWLARNLTGSYLALKIVCRTAFEHDRPFEREFEGIKRFEPISRTDSSQVAILHVGRGEDYFYYVMELADDANSFAVQETKADSRVQESEIPAPGTESYVPQTLKRMLLDRGAMPAEECLEIALSLTRALAHLHKNGLVHRDIKPSNVIFVNGIAKLADIGLVTSVDATRSYVGTEGYLPPEGAGTPQADIYSFGKVLYEMNTGCDRSQFPALPRDFATRPDRNAISELNAVVVRACQIDPRQRYESAREMDRDLSLLRRGKSVRRQQTMNRRFALGKQLLVTGMILAAMLGTAYRFLFKDKPDSLPTRAAEARTKSVAAFLLYLQAYDIFKQRNADAAKASRDYLKQAIKLDHRFVRAWGLRFWIALQGREADAIGRILEELDEDATETHAARAWLAYANFDFRKADQEFRIAVIRRPKISWALFLRSIFLVQCGRLEEARTQLAELEELEPGNHGIPSFRGDCAFMERDYTNAIRYYTDALKLSQQAPRPYQCLATTYDAMKDFPKAIEMLSEARLRDGEDSGIVAEQKDSLLNALKNGPAGYWRVRLDQQRLRSNENNDPYTFARLFARLDMPKKAFDLLELAWKQRDERLRFLLINQEWDELRETPRFQALVEDIRRQTGWPPNAGSTAPRANRLTE